MAAAAAEAAALAVLNTVCTNHAHDAALVDVSTALQTMDLAIRTFDPARPMRICDTVCLYASAFQRANSFRLWRERNPGQAAKFTQQEWDEEMKAYGVMDDAVHGAVQRNTFFLLGTMRNPVFRHSFTAKLYEDFSDEARVEHFKRDSQWHEFAVLLRNRVVGCLSPFHPWHFAPPSLDLWLTVYL
jgi:hypothetical protein